MDTILITGGTGKFGRILIDFFLKKSVRVVFTSTSAGKVADVLAAYPEEASRLTGIVVDLAAEDGIRLLLEELDARQLAVDHLVNNARSLASLAAGPGGLTSRQHFMDEFLLDVVVPYEVTMALANRQGSQLKTVINIGSQYGQVAPNPALYTDFESQSAIQYGVAKAGLSHLTKELAVRLAGRNIRVNCVGYGGVRGRVDEAFEERYGRLVPSGRMLDEAQIPGPIDYLISDASSAMTGQTLRADGGWTIW